jgi:hypothetical protein
VYWFSPFLKSGTCIDLVAPGTMAGLGLVILAIAPALFILAFNAVLRAALRIAGAAAIIYDFTIIYIYNDIIITIKHKNIICIIGPKCHH